MRTRRGLSDISPSSDVKQKNARESGAVGDRGLRLRGDYSVALRLCQEIVRVSPADNSSARRTRGPSVSAEAKKVRARKMIRELRTLGYRVELLQAPSSNPA